MTRRDLLLLLAGAANEQSRALIRQLYARPPRGERDRAKLAPPPTVAPGTAGTKTPKKRRNVTDATQV